MVDSNSHFKGRAFTRKAFSNSVKSIQDKLGSRDQMQRLETLGDARNALDDNLIQFIGMRTSLYLSTASADGEPYLQHRGGPVGFIEVVDDQTLRIPDYPGNKHYITMGNITENPRAFLFMIDYETKTRVKFWCKAEIENLTSENRFLMFKIDAWDINCNQHLPEFYSLQTLQIATKRFSHRIAELEAEVERLKSLT